MVMQQRDMKPFLQIAFVCYNHLIAIATCKISSSSGKMKAWTRREAVLRLEERMAKGEPVIDPNFVPANVIESMVPPEGDWEEEWLRAQPSVRSDTKSKFYTQVSP